MRIISFCTPAGICYVNPEHISSIGYSQGEDGSMLTTLTMSNGGHIQVRLPLEEVLRRIKG